MNIHSIGSASSLSTTNFLSMKGRMQPPDPSEMKAKMDAKIAELKKSNPELAEKLEKIQSRMDELRQQGVSPQEARKTIESEFGKPTEEEMMLLGPSKDQQSSSQGMTLQYGASSSIDVYSVLSSQLSNDQLLQLLQSRLQAQA